MCACCMCIQVFSVKVEKKLGEVVNRLNKTKEQRKPNLQEEWEERDQQERIEKKRRDEEMVLSLPVIEITSIHL